jgi:protein-S-isoprenylcysteine O-methyltransferase Ste14
MQTDYLLLALLWVCYCIVHSALISITITTYFKRALGNRYRFYPLAFNVFSIITLIALLIYSHSSRFQGRSLFDWSGNWRILQYCIMALAAALIIAGARQYSISQFLGIRQIFEHNTSGAMALDGTFEKTGVLGVVRHPWYVAVFLLLWAGNLNMAAIMINLVLSMYLAIGTMLEERKLVIEFGDGYRRYQQQVSMFIPLKWLRDKRRRISSQRGGS